MGCASTPSFSPSVFPMKTSTLLEETQDLDKKLKLFCMQGEGQGQMSEQRKKISFDFESFLQKKLWVVEMDLSTIGSEFLSLEYEQKILSGSFVSRIQEALETQTQALYPEVLSALSFLFNWLQGENAWYKNCQIYQDKSKGDFFSYCNATHENHPAEFFIGDTSGYVLWNLSSGYRFLWSYESYKKWKVQILKENKEWLQLHLIFNSCDLR